MECSLLGEQEQSHSAGTDIIVQIMVDSTIIKLEGHLRHDYLIKYAYLVKCYLERFAFISDPEK